MAVDAGMSGIFFDPRFLPRCFGPAVGVPVLVWIEERDCDSGGILVGVGRLLVVLWDDRGVFK